MNTSIAIFCPSTLADWEQWLAEHHQTESCVWVVLYAKSSPKANISWREAVDVALCYGWIDSKKIKVDHETAHQYFSKRRAKSTWSKVNKERVAQLTAENRMQKAGLASIELAQLNGSWNSLDATEALLIPDDLALAFEQHPQAHSYFLSLSKSKRKEYLSRLSFAKQEQTRQKRIAEILALATSHK